MYWLLLSLALWGLVHSILASQAAKTWFRRLFGDGATRFYRFAYNIFSVVSLLPALWLMVLLPDRALYRIPAPWLYLTLAGQVVAILMEVVGVLQTDTLAFIGLRQLFKGEEESGALVVHGLYRWVRHPLYTGGLLFIWLTPIMTTNTLILFSAATIYIIVGAYFEERKLMREYGEAYAAYKAVTPMLLPSLRPRRERPKAS